MKGSKTNKKRSIVAITAISLAVLITILSALNYLPGIYVKSQKEELETINNLLAELGHEQIDVSQYNSYNPKKAIQRVEYLKTIQKTLNNKSTYQQEKLNIEKSFEQNIQSYIEKTKDFSELNTDFLNINFAELDFQTKKDPATFLKTLKTQFRQAVINYNQSAEKPIRWKINPDEEINLMTTEEKIGQLLGISIEALELNEYEQSLVRDKFTGTVILFGQNISDENQVKKLAESIQKLNPKYPVFITTDQEGDPVKRIYWDTTASHTDIGNMSIEDQCNQWNQRSILLSSLGINWNLGIVADISLDPASFIYSRTFSEDYNKAAESVKEAVECSTNTITTLKHFPGHGSTFVDTHLQLGTMSIESEEEWKEKDAKPFLSGINSDTIMFGHLIMTWLDNQSPATLSKTAHDYIRQELGFKNLIVTDDMRMLESAGYDYFNAIKSAVAAGNDIILSSIVDNRRGETLDIINELYQNQVLTEEQLNESVKRVLAAKNKIISTSERYIPEDLVY